MKQYTAGTAIRLSVAFTVVATAAPVDPTAVTGKVRKPDGSDVTLTVVKDSTGNYIGRFLVTQQPF